MQPIVTAQQPLVLRVDIQFGNTVVVKQHLVVVANLYDVYVGDDIFDPTGSVAIAGFRVEFTDNPHCGEHLFQRCTKAFGDLSEVAFINLIEMITDDAGCQGIIHVKLSELNEQAFAQVSCAYPGRVKALNDLQDSFDIGARHLENFRHFSGMAIQVAVLVDVANEIQANLLFQIAWHGQRELPQKVVCQRGFVADRGFERGNVSAVLGGEILIAPLLLQIDLPVRFKILASIIERRFDSFRFCQVAVRFLVCCNLLKKRVLKHFLLDSFYQFQARQRQEFDRLLQRRRHDQPLRRSQR